MGIKDRVKRLEQRRRGPEYCPECGSRILLEEILPGGERCNPDDLGPCEACSNAGFGGAVGVIEVVLGEEVSGRGGEHAFFSGLAMTSTPEGGG